MNCIEHLTITATYFTSSETEKAFNFDNIQAANKKIPEIELNKANSSGKKIITTRLPKRAQTKTCSSNSGGKVIPPQGRKETPRPPQGEG